MNFKKWLLEEGSNPGSKTGLYPLGYGGIGLYPPSWYPTRSADAIFYLSIDDRIYRSKDNESLKGLPKEGSKNKMNSGEDGIWSIKHLKGEKIKTGKDYSANYGDGGIWSIKHLKGNQSVVKNKEFIPDGGEGGLWNIKKV